MEVLVVIVLGLLGIAAATTIAPRLRVASPLLLVVLGIGVSFLPFIPDVEIDPEWILAGLLPPLLYASAIAMPSMEFRREFGAISGLSIGLVVVSSGVLGLLFAWLIPDLGLALGIALGAIVSPTDAVATSIVKRVGVSPRIVTVLEGESLLNDASALVLLRSAIAATAASVTFWDVVGDFVFAVGVAVVLGWVVGRVNLWVRSRVKDATVNTVISFTVPFLASLPADALGASGLVAAVVAGLVTGRGAIRSLAPGHRISDAQNWRAIELILEGTVFLILGLELSTLIDDLANEQLGVEVGVLLALAALAAVIAVRAGYIAVTLWILARRRRRAAAMRPRIEQIQQRLDAHDLAERAEGAVEVEEAAEAERGEGTAEPASSAVGSGSGSSAGSAADAPGTATPGASSRRGGRRDRGGDGSRLHRVRRMLRRKAADIDYFLAVPLGWREGAVIVWAGMRGAVTLAAAQTLPHDTPGRSLLIITAFFVAALSLLIQGGTLGWFVRLVKPAPIDRAAVEAERAEVDRLTIEVARRISADRREATEAARSKGEEGREIVRQLRLEIVAAQREALLEARDDGIYSSSALSSALDALDAEQISMELRGES
ncbi:sodium:proton antiporter [Agromyces intestinalis]|uniref:Sodium:proton antiporter n=1 Tax=Agromyces intestinalis TaxID=2592652 RepID=A0A5C1YEK5_9MICO|nr:cation:proton antiporter [Agromyces intestinalis]QEO13222.1 sodium:proton antiporter [Agromyces intestinalis]